MMNVHADKIIANKFIGEFENASNNDGISIGMIIPFSGNGDIPVGFLLCNGASVSRTTYADLFAIIGTTYGSVDEEHFNLPNFTSRFAEGAETAGEYKEAGLPNIEGKWESSSSLNNSNAQSGMGELNARDIEANFLVEEGALYTSKYRKQSSYFDNGSVHEYPDGLGFDASLSNPIYGNSDTVQPSSLTVRYIIKAFNGVSSSTTDIEVTQLANDLADKANIALTNIVDNVDFVVESYNDEEGNWYRLYKSGWLEQGGKIAKYPGIVTVTYPKHFANVQYSILVNYEAPVSAVASAYALCGANLTTTTFQTMPYDYNSTWFACGMGTEE